MYHNRVIIFANGSYEKLQFYREQLQKNDYIICADGGANYALKMGLVPNLVLGDMDSIDPKEYQKLAQSVTEICKYPAEKDESDLELALDRAVALSPQEILIFGALGKRVDHLYANMMLLGIPLKNGIKAKIIDPEHEIQLMEKELTICGSTGDYVSLFPLTEVVAGVTTKGLKYGLDDATLYSGTSLGLSNELTETIANIAVTEGRLLVIKVKKIGN